MTARALPFCEMLEDEYRYFFGEVPYKSLELEARHVREMGHLATRLKLLAENTNAESSRWKYLADKRNAKPGQTPLETLNDLLGNKKLLADLLTNDEDAREAITSPRVWTALLSVPHARRLLLADSRLEQARADDRELIDRFAGSSAAIRVLIGDDEDFRRSLRKWPVLLSTIADDADLADRLVRDRDGASASDLRFRLRALFPPPPRFSLSAEIKQLFRGTVEESGNEADPTEIAKDNAKLRAALALPDAEKKEEEKEAHLSRFNAILIETFYREYLSDGQAMRSVYAAMHEQNTAALCLSGGGIRSATFSLGILQGLADHRMLNRFHYISTVSGGGYIGSWLSSWMRRHREGPIGVAEDVSREPSDPLQPEVEPIAHLRQYSSYLAPRATAFSLDSWTLAAIYIRNLLLNWTILIPALAVVLAIPRLLEAALHPDSGLHGDGVAFFAAVLLIVSLFAVGLVRPANDAPVSATDAATRRYGFLIWFGPLVSSAFAFCIYWACPNNAFEKNPELLPYLFALAGALGAAAFGFRRTTHVAPTATFWGRVKAAAVTATHPQDVLFQKRVAAEFAASIISGLIAGWLLQFTFSRAFAPARIADGVQRELFACVGVPLFLATFFVYAGLVVGITSAAQRSDHDREWWARNAAAVLLFGVFHLCGAFAVLLLPVLLFQAPAITAPFGGLSALGTWLLARASKARDAKTSITGGKLMPLLRISAVVTLLFLVALIAILSSRTLGWMNGREILVRSLADSLTPLPAPTPWQLFGDYPYESTTRYLAVLRQTRFNMVLGFVAFAALLSTAMSLLLNVNVYSMHSMYRNRLIRAYLGASRWSRRPDPFTGFDPRDNIAMWKLRPHLLWITSFIDFDTFSDKLVNEAWWKNERLTQRSLVAARERLSACKAAKHDATKEAKAEAAAAVADAISDLMRVWDLEHNVAAPPTFELVVANRAYLEKEFGDSLKKLSDGAAVSNAEFLKTPNGAEVPAGPMQDATPTDVRTTPPLHVLNATLNIVGGSNLAWQERKAASFTISPLHSGGAEVDYRDTAVFGEGISLGTAMAVSGAAVSPNMGALSSPAFTFLMTFFNARLGWWIGNPKHATHKQASPRFSLLWLLREALGRTNANHRYVFLSDGGHFENLGIYEMVKRRCRYIIACDASADGKFGFGDLANAVRKVRIDLGIPIEPLLTKYIGPQKDERYGRYCALGEIRYEDVDGTGAGIGYLLYIKPCVLPDCPADVRNYANQNIAFPHESTADQFFSESQFESYRALGRHIIGKICGDDVGNAARVAPNVPTFFANAWSYVHGKIPPVGDATIETVSDVVNWMTTALTPQDRLPVRGQSQAANAASSSNTATTTTTSATSTTP